MKDIMYKEGAHGSFEYLGPLDFKTRTQAKLLDVHDITEVEKCLLDRYKGETLTFNNVLERMCIPWDLEPRYKKTHYRKAILQLEKEKKCSVERISSKRTVKEEDIITFFPTDNLSNAIN
jgi:hypothetical protein